MAFFCKKSQLETDIEREILEVKSKMEGISMVDEFAKYAKLERKMNALREHLKVESKIIYNLLQVCIVMRHSWFINSVFLF